jgi:CheY-like chemotaxis protein
MHGTSDDAVAIDLTGLRIMVVDDNIDVADVLSEILESKGAVTVTLSDPAEAHALLRKKPRLWSLLVTDHDMPVMTGNQLAQAAASCNPPVPCILVTAHSEKASYDSKLFAAVHTKPVDAATFLRSVHGVVRRKTKGRKLSLK